MATRSCREKAQKQNEQHQAILAKLLREEDNKYCADCEAKGSYMKRRKNMEEQRTSLCCKSVGDVEIESADVAPYGVGGKFYGGS
ncbi:hypothetical protein DUI87_10928 [Hirundo rustica rustica]|uniref:Uncharacterized protein n=1 Tax=Hirundo rustica rustica TaxID=333673 RepID=A0A3M0KJY5_HIRRU|nr:hypothetical protein DUI87_10928 [Hirundo rustica rustica]